MILRPEDEAIYNEVMNEDVYGAYKPKPTDVVIDAGAYIGIYALKIAPFVRRVYSIEANPETFEILKVNTKSAENVIPMNYAIWDKHGWIEFKKAKFPAQSRAGIFPDHLTSETVTVKMETLDDIVPENRVDFIKMDIEGAEALALSGASRLLLSKPLIIMEVHNEYEQVFGKVKSILEPIGYKFDYPNNNSDQTRFIAVCRA